MAYADKLAKVVKHPLNIIHMPLDTPNEVDGDYFCDYQSPLGQRFWPCVDKIELTPAKLVVRGVGTFGGIKVTLKNFSYGANGTFFGKLMANNRYFLDRPLHLYTGFHDNSAAFSWDNFVQRSYIIRSIKGPDENGKVVIDANSILIKLASDDAIAPLPTTGVLESLITNVYTGNVVIGDVTGFNPSGGVALIGGAEYVTYSEAHDIGGGSFIVVTARGQYGSVAEEWEAGESVVNCLLINNENAADVIYDLIDTYTNIDVGTYIDLAAWNAERDRYLVLSSIFRIISEPMKISEIINEICKNTFLSLFEVDTSQTLKILRVGSRVETGTPLNTSDNVLKEGHKIDRDLTKAVTKVFAWHGKIYQAEDDNAGNFNGVHTAVNAEAEIEYNFSIAQELFLGWVGENSLSQAIIVATNLTSVYKYGETIKNFRLDIKDCALSIGDSIELTSIADEGSDGNPVTESCLVIEKIKINDCTYAYKALVTGFVAGRYAVIAPDALAGLQYADATEEQRSMYIFISDDSGLMSDGSEGYQIL